MSQNMPKRPDKDIMKMLIRANQFLEHAKNHAQSGSDFDIMIAIHNLDNAIEYMLRILIRHLDIEEITGKTISTCELAQLIGEVQKFLKDKEYPGLSHVKELKMIRELRNMVQHAMINPAGDIKVYLNYGENFFEKSLMKYFAIRKAELRLSTLIKSKVLQERIKNAEEKMDENNFLESIVQSRDAFDYAKFLYCTQMRGRLWNAPALSEIKESYSNLYMMLEDMNESIILNSMNINMSQYIHYSEYIDCIPREYNADWSGNTVLQREWNRSDAEFCYLFVANVILDWENHHMEPIQSFEVEESPYALSERLCGIETIENFVEKSCRYALEEKTARLFYVSSKTSVDTLKEAATKKILCAENKRWVFDRLQMHYTELKEVISFDSRFVMNNPPTWEVIVFYNDIPFTEKNMLEDTNISIDDEYHEQVDENTRKIIKEYMPLDSIEKAKELKKRLQEVNIENVNMMYSDELVRRLTKM